MVDIRHRVGATAPVADVYRALTTVDGLAAWWTEQTTRDGDLVRFRFSGAGGFDMRVLAEDLDSRVVWEVVDGPDEWLGTTITFDLAADGEWAIVSFTHAGWAEPVDFLHHCSTKWATFLLSLQRFVETGRGAPHPHDVRVDNWD